MIPDYRDTFKHMLPLRDASKVVKLSERTLRNWRSQGKYPEIFVKFGGKVFVDMSIVGKIIESEKAANLKRLKM